VKIKINITLARFRIVLLMINEINAMNKKVIITGATGFIGKVLCKTLIENGYTVVALTRNTQNAKQILGDITCLHLQNISEIERVLTGDYSIINLAGENIAEKKWTEKRKQQVLQSRVQIGNYLRVIVESAPVKPRCFIQASAIGYYGSSDFIQGPFNEWSECGFGFLPKVVKHWEMSTEALATHTRLVVARTGIVVSNEGGMLKQLLLPFKFGMGGHLGTGEQVISWIRMEDEIKILIYFLENEKSVGIYNLTAPNPVNMKIFCIEIAKKLKKRSWFHVTARILRLFFGKEMTDDMILLSQNVVPDRLLDEGFSFDYADHTKIFDGLALK